MTKLRWHSFKTYLHSCVSSSLHNESYTDVALVTTDGRQIMAHRLVLAYSSQFLKDVLKFQPKVNTYSPLMIVLPPEISFNTLKILVEYMYSGEATVTKDVLDSVLKGGEILKVKGLYRPMESKQGSESGMTTSGPVAINKVKRVQHKLKTITIPRNVQSQPNTKVLNVKHTPPVETPNLIGRTMEGEEQNDDEDIKETLQLLEIKNEAIECQEMELIDDKSALSDLQVKQEDYSEDSANTEDNEQLYTPLTCELCNQTFTLPRDWVRHVQTHPYTLPFKRQRGDATIGDIMPDGPVTQDESAFKKRLQSNLFRHIRKVNDKILPPNNLGKTNDEG